jgi:hypothetical protein
MANSQKGALLYRDVASTLRALDDYSAFCRKPQAPTCSHLLACWRSNVRKTLLVSFVVSYMLLPTGLGFRDHCSCEPDLPLVLEEGYYWQRMSEGG